MSREVRSESAHVAENVKSVDPDETPTQRHVPSLLPPLPEGDAPFSDQLPVLTLRAEAGDPVAACRLIVGANRCIEASRSRAFTEKMMRSVETREGRHDDLMVQSIARSQELNRHSDVYCRGVDTRSVPKSDELFRRVAPALTPRQKVVLALMRSDGQVRRLHGNPSFSESALYVLPQFLADHAHEFLQQGYQARDPLALEGLVMIHAPGRAIHTQGIRLALPNPRLFLKYAGLMRRLYGDSVLEGAVGRLMQATINTMSPEMLVELEREVDDEYRRWTMNQPAGSSVPPLGEPGQATSQELCTD